MSPSLTAERDDWARNATDNLIGRGSEQRQVNGTAPPHTDHNHIGGPISGHSKDFLIRLAENDRFVTTAALVSERDRRSPQDSARVHQKRR